MKMAIEMKKRYNYECPCAELNNEIMNACVHNSNGVQLWETRIV